MPLYEYECDACGKRFERIQKFSDPPPEACPACGGAVRKLLSSPAIQFKGTGWYITDYAKKSGTGTDTKPESATDASTETKSASESKESKESKSAPSSGTTSTAKASGE